MVSRKLKSEVFVVEMRNLAHGIDQLREPVGILLGSDKKPVSDIIGYAVVGEHRIEISFDDADRCPQLMFHVLAYLPFVARFFLLGINLIAVESDKISRHVAKFVLGEMPCVYVGYMVGGY